MADTHQDLALMLFMTIPLLPGFSCNDSGRLSSVPH